MEGSSTVWLQIDNKAQKLKCYLSHACKLGFAPVKYSPLLRDCLFVNLLVPRQVLCPRAVRPECFRILHRFGFLPF